MTAKRTVDEAVTLLETRFDVGLSHRLDETLLLWKQKLRLDTRDIIYASMKASLPHPSVSEWHPDEQAAATTLIDASGDSQYWLAAKNKFERQIEKYGADKLMTDLSRFRGMLARMEHLCGHMPIMSENLHVSDRVFCMLGHYDRAYVWLAV